MGGPHMHAHEKHLINLPNEPFASAIATRLYNKMKKIEKGQNLHFITSSGLHPDGSVDVFVGSENPLNPLLVGALRHLVTIYEEDLTPFMVKAGE